MNVNLRYEKKRREISQEGRKRKKMKKEARKKKGKDK